MELRPFSSRPNLCTVIDFANARAARAVGLSPGPHIFQVGDLVVLADGAQGRILEFRGSFALVSLAGHRCGIHRAAAISTMRKLPAPDGGDAA
jgi:hypothetical protein